MAEDDELRIHTLRYGSPFEILITGAADIVDTLAVSLSLSVPLGWVGKEMLKDGGKNAVDLANIRQRVRTKRATLQADEAEARMRLERANKSLEALGNTASSRSGENASWVHREAGHISERRSNGAREDDELIENLVSREIEKVTSVAGPADVHQPAESGADFDPTHSFDMDVRDDESRADQE
ncbi:MAG: hypothetical protein ACRDDJ_09100 [[Mycobacterium] stephanolepidis]